MIRHTIASTFHCYLIVASSPTVTQFRFATTIIAIHSRLKSRRRNGIQQKSNT